MIAEGEKLALKVWGGRHLTPEEIDSFLSETKIARFCCLNDDGTIHATPVWFLFTNRQFKILTPDESRKAKIIKQNDSVTILVDIEEPPRGVMIYGTAQPETNFELEPTVISLCEKYMSKDKAQAMAQCLPSKYEVVENYGYTHTHSFIHVLGHERYSALCCLVR